MSEALFGLLGTLFGFALGELANLLRTIRQERREARNVRALLRLEIERNLERMRGLIERLVTDRTPAANESERKNRAQRLIEASAPDLSRDALGAFLPQLPATLNEAQIGKVLSHYEGVAKLNTLYNRLVELQDSQRQLWSGYRAGQGTPPSMPFSNQAPEIWAEYESLLLALDQAGNPL